MISSWRRKRAGRRAAKEEQRGEKGELELMIPNHFRCPISLDLMKDPVTLSTGITYDRQSIETWIDCGNQTCPITNQVLRSLEPTPNHTLRKMVQDWCVENQSYGIERIPTPRIPVSSAEVSEILSKITAASKRGDQVGCGELAAKIKALGKESERSKRCIAGNKTAGGVLSAAFETFSRSSVSFDANGAVLEEILSALTIFFPLDEQAKSNLGSAASLHSMVWFLKSGDLSGRSHAILALKELLHSSDESRADALAEIEGALEALMKMITEPICPTSTKASLMVIYHMINNSSYQNETIIQRFVDMGLVSLLLETLVDSERSICERAMGVLDVICSGEKGREKAYSHALTVPVSVKKLLRVSDLTTEFSVSILWKLCKNEKTEEGGVLVEALQVGAFQKLLLLLQVGCAERTREKATELLKSLNLHRDKLECIDSMDFKDLKRPF
jgi:hypothetical protein